jgi:hypothetical protein
MKWGDGVLAGWWRRADWKLRDIKYATQRKTRGYSDCDVWNTNDYLAKIILDALVRFKNSERMGYPSNLNSTGWKDNPTKDEENALVNEWESILDKMIWSFRFFTKDCHTDESEALMNEIFGGHKIEFEPIDGDNEFVRMVRPKYDETKLATYYELQKKEYVIYEEGMVLFAKHFGALWD